MRNALESGATPYEINGRHLLGLPGLNCPTCSAWSTSGLHYPTITAAQLPPSLRPIAKAEGWPLSLDDWNGVREAALPLLTDGVIVRPGTAFGPLSLKMRGRALDFTWLGTFTVLVKEPILEMLRASGHVIHGMAANIRWSGKGAEPLVELEIRPRVRLTESQRAPFCNVCGRQGQKAPDTVILDPLSYESTICIQRIAELPTYLIASEAFHETVERHRFTGVRFTPVRFPTQH